MIRIERPPNYDEIVKVFPLAAGKGILFAYGEDIFNPSDARIPPALVAHEYKHCARQFLTSPSLWWTSYLTDSAFRYREELIAHAAEFRTLVGQTRDRNARWRILDQTAWRLTAALYNYAPNPTHSNAMRHLLVASGI